VLFLAAASASIEPNKRLDGGDADMPLLDLLADIDNIIEDPAWIMFGLAGAVGVLGLLALIIFYPMGRD
jgi:hypothetical protein